MKIKIDGLKQAIEMLQGLDLAAQQALIAEIARKDPEMAIKLLRLFEALNRLGTTVVVATHDVHLLKKVPDSLIMRLDKGRLSDPTGALRYPPRPAFGRRS